MKNGFGVCAVGVERENMKEGGGERERGKEERERKKQALQDFMSTMRELGLVKEGE